jgi:hypothetical protein
MGVDDCEKRAAEQFSAWQNQQEDPDLVNP